MSRKRKLTFSSKSRPMLLKLPKITKKETEIKVRDSFAWAFFSKKMQYVTELVYDKFGPEKNDCNLYEPKV